MPALPGAAHGLPTALIYRAPNIGAVSDMVMATRGVNMGRLIKTGLDGAYKAGEALAEGLHVGMLVDQYYVRGVPVTFFGRQHQCQSADCAPGAADSIARSTAPAWCGCRTTASMPN